MKKYLKLLRVEQWVKNLLYLFLYSSLVILPTLIYLPKVSLLLSSFHSLPVLFIFLTIIMILKQTGNILKKKTSTGEWCYLKINCNSNSYWACNCRYCFCRVCPAVFSAAAMEICYHYRFLCGNESCIYLQIKACSDY